MFSFVEPTFNYYITNIVGCRPTLTNEFGNVVNRAPVEAEIEACKPRLDQLMLRYEFDGIVYVGDIPSKYRAKEHLGKKSLFNRAIKILHPAYILRQEFKLYDIKLQALKITEYVNSTKETGGVNSHRRR